MNRRSFLGFLVSAPLTRALPWQKISAVLAPVIPAISAEIDLLLAEIISRTIRVRMEELVANVEANNALLRRLTQRNEDDC